MIGYWKKVVLENYANFRGRADRPEFWYFVLVNLLVYVVLFFIASIADSGIFYGLVVIYALAMIIPGLAVAVRRLHDTGKSAWYLLVELIPLIGGLVLLVLLAFDGDHGPNQYGPSPKYS